MIDVINVTKKFGDFTAIQDLSFHVDKASVYGLVGYNGAGKTTLLKTLAGVYRADGGQVQINGESVFENVAIKQQLFYVPDDLFFKAHSNMNTMAKFYKGYYPNFNGDTFEKLASVFGLDRTKKINGFSKGMQRQAELVLGLATRPQILLLDESFDGLDPQKRNLVKNIVLEYMAEEEISVVISSHNLHELGDMCDHIGLINGKRLALDCSVDEMNASRCKYRVVFGRDVDENEFVSIPYKNFKKDGSIVSFTVSGDFDVIEREIQKLSPLVVEKFPLSVEEIFLEEMEGTDYDYAEIFK